jgi:hypothetical protein
MQSDRLTYSEIQRFRQWWLWVLCLVFPVSSLWALVQQIIVGSFFGSNPEGFMVLIILVIIGGLFTWFMYTTGLDTEVYEEGLRIRFLPFHRNWRVYLFSYMQKAEAITYRPLMDYGGWGIRSGRKGKAYNVSGNKGVLLTFRDGNHVLIGSNNHQVLFSAVNEGILSNYKTESNN